MCSHLHPDHCGCNTFFKRASCIIHAKEIEAARGPGAENAGYLAREWEQFGADRGTDGERDLFGDGRVVLIPLPGHTPGRTGALVALERSGKFLLAADSVSAARHARPRHSPAQYLECRRARAIARRNQAHRAAGRDRDCAATTPRNGKTLRKGADVYD